MNSRCTHCNRTGHLRLKGVLVEQGGVVIRLDGSGQQLLRGNKLAFVRTNLPRHPEGSSLHTVTQCDKCDTQTIESHTDTRKSLLYQVTTFTDSPLKLKELWCEG